MSHFSGRYLRLYSIFLFGAVPAAAYAYVDPNAGGWLYQMLFPLLVAIAGAWAVLRQKLNELSRRIFGKSSEDKNVPRSGMVDSGNRDERSDT